MGGAVPGHTAANSVKHSSWKHGEGVYPASKGWYSEGSPGEPFS